jgi:LruC domain-containing protein
MRLWVAALLSAVPTSAMAQDHDGDGVDSFADAFPCDPQRAAISYFPSETSSALLVYEDQWPFATDADFNDVAVRVNWRLDRDRDGRVVSMRAIIDPVALGGAFSNGLALEIPGNTVALTAIVTTHSGGSRPIAPVDGVSTYVLSENLRELFGGVGGPVNSVLGAPRLEGETLTFELSFPDPRDLSVAEAPFDLFVFRAGDLSHQIHFPQYDGTALMNGALFGAGEDGSTVGRRFVHRSGVPAALNLMTSTRYPLEGVEIATLFPSILEFAATGGAAAADFYARATVFSAGHDIPPNPVPPGAPADTSCVVGSDVPGSDVPEFSLPAYTCFDLETGSSMPEDFFGFGCDPEADFRWAWGGSSVFGWNEQYADAAIVNLPFDAVGALEASSATFCDYVNDPVCNGYPLDPFYHLGSTSWTYLIRTSSGNLYKVGWLSADPSSAVTTFTYALVNEGGGEPAGECATPAAGASVLWYSGDGDPAWFNGGMHNNISWTEPSIMGTEMVLEDFVVPGPASWCLTEVWSNNVTNARNPITAAQWELRAHDPLLGLPGPVIAGGSDSACTAINQEVRDFFGATQETTVKVRLGGSLCLSPGTYWVGVAPVISDFDQSLPTDILASAMNAVGPQGERDNAFVLHENWITATPGVRSNGLFLTDRLGSMNGAPNYSMGVAGFEVP